MVVLLSHITRSKVALLKWPFDHFSLFFLAIGGEKKSHFRLHRICSFQKFSLKKRMARNLNISLQAKKEQQFNVLANMQILSGITVTNHLRITRRACKYTNCCAQPPEFPTR
jgi:hypothetical protein